MYSEHLFCERGLQMDQYIEYLRQSIVETITNTNDKEIIKFTYDMLMNNQNSETKKYLSVS